jgi:hypothetical protein
VFLPPALLIESGVHRGLCTYFFGDETLWHDLTDPLKIGPTPKLSLGEFSYHGTQMLFNNETTTANPDQVNHTMEHWRCFLA